MKFSDILKDGAWRNGNSFGLDLCKSQVIWQNFTCSNIQLQVKCIGHEVEIQDRVMII